MGIFHVDLMFFFMVVFMVWFFMSVKNQEKKTGIFHGIRMDSDITSNSRIVDGYLESKFTSITFGYIVGMVDHGMQLPINIGILPSGKLT